MDMESLGAGHAFRLQETVFGISSGNTHSKFKAHSSWHLTQIEKYEKTFNKE